MAGNKKPAKAYRPKVVLNPMNVRDAWKTEGEVYAALMSLDAGTMEMAHYSMLCAHADVMRRVYPSGAVNVQAATIMRMVDIIMKRSDRHVTPAESDAIRAATTVTLPAMRSTPNRKLVAASVDSLKDIDRLQGVRLSL